MSQAHRERSHWMGLVRELLCDRLGLDDDEIDGATRIYDELGLDSIDAQELLTAIEKRAEVRFADERAIDFSSVETLADLVDAFVEATRPEDERPARAKAGLPTGDRP